MRNYFVYFLESLRDGKYYIGCTSKEPIERLKEHNAGMVKSTRHRTPLQLAYSKKFGEKEAAFKWEWHLKHPRGYQEKLDIIKKIKGPVV